MKRYKLLQFDMLAVIVVVGVAAFLVGWTVPGATGKSAVGVAGIVPAALPAFHVPVIKLKWLLDLSTDALAIAFLGLLEALSIAKAIASETRQPLDYNRQILAEGLANLAGSFFRALPGSGSLSRSAINYQAGGATRFSGILTAAEDRLRPHGAEDHSATLAAVRDIRSRLRVADEAAAGGPKLYYPV